MLLVYPELVFYINWEDSLVPRIDSISYHAIRKIPESSIVLHTKKAL
jgi:hypothetical protein